MSSALLYNSFPPTAVPSGDCACEPSTGRWRREPVGRYGSTRNTPVNAGAGTRVSRRRRRDAAAGGRRQRGPRSRTITADRLEREMHQAGITGSIVYPRRDRGRATSRRTMASPGAASTDRSWPSPGSTAPRRRAGTRPADSATPSVVARTATRPRVTSRSTRTTTAFTGSSLTPLSTTIPTTTSSRHSRTSTSR